MSLGDATAMPPKVGWVISVYESIYTIPIVLNGGTLMAANGGGGGRTS